MKSDIEIEIRANGLTLFNILSPDLLTLSPNDASAFFSLFHPLLCLYRFSTSLCLKAYPDIIKQYLG